MLKLNSLSPRRGIRQGQLGPQCGVSRYDGCNSKMPGNGYVKWIYYNWHLGRKKIFGLDEGEKFEKTEVIVIFST